MSTQIPDLAAGLSAILFCIALFGTVYVGIRKLVICTREGKSALSAPLLDNGMRRIDYGKLFVWLLVTTLFVFLAGVGAQIALFGKERTLWEHFLAAFQKSDALHYVNVAQNGYTSVGETRFFVVFFPLFPWLLRFFSIFTGGNTVLAAIILNFGLMYAAIVTVFKLGLMDFPRDTVWGAVKMLLLFPLAFFFHNAYSEPLFLLTCALSLYYTRKDNYALAGVFGFLCALSRASGVLCAVPLVARSFIGAFESGKFRPWQWLKKAAWSMVTLLGTGCYLLLNFVVTGNPLMFLVHQREHWYNFYRLFPYAVKTVTSRLLTNVYAHHTALWVSQFSAIFLFLVLLVIGIKKLSTEMSLFCCGYFLMMISQNWLLSGPRYLMVVFPLYFALSSALKNNVWRTVVQVAFAIGLLVMTSLFSIGHSIY